MRSLPSTRDRFESVYSVVVLIKGLDGTVELLLGVLLVVVPSTVQQVLVAVATELGEGTSTLRLVLAGAAESGGDDVGAGVLGLALFLLVHGVVKLLTVYCLIRRQLRWYPWAIGVLAVLLVVQVIDGVLHPTPGPWVLSTLDLLVLLLVVFEYRRLRADADARPDRRAHAQHVGGGRAS